MLSLRHTICALILGCLAAGVGCTGYRSSARDLQVLKAANKAEALQTQRTILDLRAEIQGLQQELGTARAAQARLEGELRDAQRSMAEAQRLADAQRAELSKTRDERDRLAQAGREAQGQLIELGKLRQQVADTERDQTRLQALEAALEKQTQDMADLKAASQKSANRFKPRFPNAALVMPPRAALDRTISSGVPVAASSRTVIVQPGDTLWDLARKHRVSLPNLIAINRLGNTRIMPGQELLLPDSPAG